MEVYQDGVLVNCLPDSARCELDSKRRSPLDLDECPWGEEFCTDCPYYAE